MNNRSSFHRQPALIALLWLVNCTETARVKVPANDQDIVNNPGDSASLTDRGVGDKFVPIPGDMGPSLGIEQWHPFDLTFSSTAPNSSKFSATFTGPGGRTLTIPGFPAASGTWKVRFAPTALGDWSYKTMASTAADLNGKTGMLHCIANTNPAVHGHLGVDKNNPHHFRYEDGTPYFMLAFEADWLALMDFGDAKIPKARSLIDMYASRGFNNVLMDVFAYCLIPQYPIG